MILWRGLAAQSFQQHSNFKHPSGGFLCIFYETCCGCYEFWKIKSHQPTVVFGIQVTPWCWPLVTTFGGYIPTMFRCFFLLFPFWLFPKTLKFLPFPPDWWIGFWLKKIHFRKRTFVQLNSKSAGSIDQCFSTKSPRNSKACVAFWSASSNSWSKRCSWSRVLMAWFEKNATVYTSRAHSLGVPYDNQFGF